MVDHETLSLWEPVIGLELHVELNTKTKLFSPAPNRFGDEPNTNISMVCTAQPGSLPVLNREAVKKAIRFGLAVGAQINHYSRFDRKSYFYPDSPRNFQITQYEMPILTGGQVKADIEGKSLTFQINRAHLEDDAGMLKHFADFAAVDYNRAGVPLIEIVSEPCLFSATQAVGYAMALKAILEYLDVSDCDMDKGSLRIDANISVRPKGEKGLRSKIEIKNMNSFNFLQLALESEFKRQVQEYIQHRHLEPKAVIEQATFRWDPEKKTTVLMRKKETAEDYRYFLEPDLPAIVLESEYIDAIAKTLPEMPYERKERYIQALGLSREGATTLTNEKQLADYFERGLMSTTNARSLCNWIVIEFAGRLKDRGIKIYQSGIQASQIAMLVNFIDEGKITGKIAKSIADLMVENPTKSCKEIIEENPDFVPLSDTGELERVVDQVIANNQQSVLDYLSGTKDRAFDSLVGQVMKATKGAASPLIVRQLLQKKIKKD